MVRIRLRRIGSKGKAFYKIIVADQRSPQKGKYIEEVGTYDPHTNPASINLMEDKISDWISKGAQPSESVYKIFNIAGFDNDGKINPLILKKKKAKKSPEQEAPAQEAPAQEAPAQEAPVEEAPAQEAPVEEAPAEEAPVEEAPVEEAPAEEAPVEDNKESEDK